MSDHALFSPSSGHKWMRCAGALAMEDGLPNTTNDSAEQGTAAHELASWTLTDGAYYCLGYLGRITSNGWEVTEEMCEATQIYVDAIRARIDEYKAAGAVEVYLYVENRVDLSNVVGVPDQFGTSDTIFLVEWRDGTWLIGVEDFKFGYRLVHAEHNEQLMLYALAALDQYGVVGNFTHARMVIHQPNRDWVSDWECSVDELLEFGKEAKLAARVAKALLNDHHSRTLGEPITDYLTPGEKQCQWCKAKANCPALQNWVEEEIGVDFDNLDKETIQTAVPEQPIIPDDNYGELLAKKRASIPLIDIYARGVLAASDAYILSGGHVPGWKVVQGKKGNRKFRDEAEAEATMKSMRLKQEEMYSFKLISPTVAEKLLKKDSPRRWKTLEKLVVQKEGAPAVVEESDKRTPLVIQSPEDDFAPIPDGDDLV